MILTFDLLTSELVRAASDSLHETMANFKSIFHILRCVWLHHAQITLTVSQFTVVVMTTAGHVTHRPITALESAFKLIDSYSDLGATESHFRVNNVFETDGQTYGV